MSELLIEGSVPAEPFGDSATAALSPFLPLRSARTDTSEIDTGILPPLVLEDSKSIHSDVGLLVANEAIRDALAGSNDTEVVAEILKGRCEAERSRMNDLYETKYGITLDSALADNYEGVELQRLLILLHAADDKVDYAAVMFNALARAAEREIRDTLAILDAKQVALMREDFLRKYGFQLDSFIATHEELSDTTKAAARVYLKGADQRSDEDVLLLAEDALAHEDIQFFQEVFRQASASARRTFLNNHGEERMDDAFSGDDLLIARDYASQGSLKTCTKILMASGVDDNEEAVERALLEMTPDERERYDRGKQLVEMATPMSSVEQVDDVITYSEIRSALEDLGNSDEVARWEDMALTRGGTLVTQLGDMDHDFNDDEQGVYRLLEDLSEEDWLHLKEQGRGERYRKVIESRLDDFLDDDERAIALNILDQKIRAGSYQEAFSINRPVQEALKQLLTESTAMVPPLVNKEAVYHAIAKMPPQDRQSYNSDPEFKLMVDLLVGDLLSDPADRAVASAMLSAVYQGKDPVQDPERALIIKLLKHAAETDTDEAAVIRDLQQAFRQVPTLRERLIKPQSTDDVELSTQFNSALLRALDQGEYERYAKPLLETGHVPIEIQMELNKGFCGDDELGAYTDILNATQAERQKILGDAEYRESVMGFLNDAEQAIALNILQQGEIRPEDRVRMNVVGAGTYEEPLLETLRESQFEAHEKNEYARKYGVDLLANLVEELGGQDKIDAKRALRIKPADLKAAFEIERYDYYASRIGKGETLDNSAALTDDAFHKLTAAVARNIELPPDEQKELVDSLHAYLDIFRRSEENAANKIVDAILFVAGIATAPFSAGGSLMFLLRCGIAGSILKVGIKSSVMGNDYDWSAQGGIDAVTGFVDGLAAGVGSGHIAAWRKVGTTGADIATKQITRAACSEAALGKAVLAEFRRTIGAGKAVISSGSVNRVVRSIGAQEVSEAKDQVAAALRAGMEAELASGLNVKKTALSLAAVTGATSLTARSVGRAVPEWDSNRSFGKNLLMLGETVVTSAPLGAGGNVLMSMAPPVGLVVLRAGIRKIRGTKVSTR